MDAKRKKPEVIHRSKLFGGKSAEQVHREIGVRKKCVGGCGLPASIRIRIFVPLTEFVDKSPEVAAGIMATNPHGPFIPSTKMHFRGSEHPIQMVKVSDVGACGLCQSTAERMAARVENELGMRGINALVEIDRGPGPDKPVVQVPGSFGGGE